MLVPKANAYLELPAKLVAAGYTWSARPSGHWAPAIVELLNQVMASSQAFYRERPMSVCECQNWLANKCNLGQPLWVLEHQQQLAAFASWQPFRPQECTQGSLEHSIYVAPEHQRRGLARLLLQQVLSSALQQGVWQLLAAIDQGNQASINLHSAFGFTQVGSLPRLARKGDQWLTLEIWAKSLQPPEPN